MTPEHAAGVLAQASNPAFLTAVAAPLEPSFLAGEHVAPAREPSP